MEMESSSEALSDSENVQPTTQSSISKENFSKVRLDLVNAKNSQEIRKYLVLNREIVEPIPVALLNSWIHAIPDIRFYKNHGYLGLRSAVSQKTNLEALTNRVSCLVERVDLLEEKLEKFSKILDLQSTELRRINDFLRDNFSENEEDGK
jgi:hypothetical protein